MPEYFSDHSDELPLEESEAFSIEDVSLVAEYLPLPQSGVLPKYLQSVQTRIRRTMEVSAQTEECERMQRGLDEARERGLIDIEEFGAEGQSRCVLFSGVHPKQWIVRPDSNPFPKRTGDSHVELFQTLKALERAGVTSPLFVEGRSDDTPPFRPSGQVNGHKILSAGGQAYLDAHPDVLLQRMTESAAQCAPLFYQYASYQGIRPGTSVFTAHNEQRFDEAYREKYIEFKALYAPLIRYMQASMSDDHMTNKPLGIIHQSRGTDFSTTLTYGNTPIDACKLSQDIDVFQRCIEDRERLFQLHEADILQRIHWEKPSKVPMAFIGKIHELPLIDGLVRLGHHVQVATPRSAAGANFLRTRHRGWQAENPLEPIDMFMKFRTLIDELLLGQHGPLHLNPYKPKLQSWLTVSEQGGASPTGSEFPKQD